MNVKKCLPLLLAGTAILCGGWSKDGESPWRRIDDSLVSPHRKFANPVSGKKQTAIIFAHGIGAREIVELKQRFEYNYYLWPVASGNKFSPFTRGHNEKSKEPPRTQYASLMNSDDYKIEVQKLLADMRKSDLIMIGKMPFDCVPTDIRFKILDHVKNGAGMILINKDGTDQTIPDVTFTPVKIDFPVDAIPALAGTKVKVGNWGKGKIMIISYPRDRFFGTYPTNRGECLTPYDCNDPLYYDYTLAFLGKCMWYMREPERKVFASISPNGTVKLNKIPAGSKIAYVVADRYGQEIRKGEMNVTKTVTVSLKDLPASAKMLDVKLLDKKGKVIDFTMTPITVKKASGIKAIVLPKDGFKPDEVITGNIELLAPVKGKLELSAVNQLGKVIYRESIPVNGSRAGFTAKIPHQKSISAVLTAKLTVNGKLLDEHKTDLFFDTTDDVSDFAFGMWSYAVSNSRVGELWLKEMGRYGVDNMMDAAIMFAPREKCSFVPRNVLKSGMRYAVYTSRIVGEHWIKYRNRCGYGYWEEYQKTGSVFKKNGKPLDDNMTEINIAKGAKNIGVLFYNLGDENAAAMNVNTENCFCKDCQRRFRTFLKREHGTIENLNRNYGSKYKSFDEITALPFTKAVEAGKYCEWLDFRMFVEEQFINWHRYLKAKIRTVDPDGRVGLEGMVYPFSSFTGFNFYKMMPHFEFCAPYYNPRDGKAIMQYMPQNAKNGVVRSAWFGAYEGEMADQFVQQPPWRYLFAGLSGAFYWFSGSPESVGGFSTSGICGPDLRMLRQFTKSADEARLIKESGLAKLLLNSQQYYDGILIHYSNNSLHAATLYPDKNTWEISHTDIHGLLGSLGLGYRYISPPELENGVPAGTKVIFLPYSQAMSAKEVEAIRQFVKNGGMVIADYNPAMANQHGRWLDKSQLADVFGKFEKMNINRYGKGYGVYLDDYISGVNARAQKNEARGIQQGMLRLLKKAGVVPFARVNDSNDIPRDFALFAHKKSVYLCMLAQRSQAGEKRTSAVGAEGGGSKDATIGGSFTRKISLVKPMHVYDILKKKYLGKIQNFTVELEPAVGRVFACLEQKAKTPVIKVDSISKSVNRGQAIPFKISGLDNTAIVTVMTPDGNVADVQRTTREKIRFVPSYNEPSGTWKVKVTDAVSGLFSETTFNVK